MIFYKFSTEKIIIDFGSNINTFRVFSYSCIFIHCNSAHTLVVFLNFCRADNDECEGQASISQGSTAVGTVRFIRQNIGTPTAVKVNFQAHIIMQFKQIENDLTIVAKYLFF